MTYRGGQSRENQSLGPTSALSTVALDHGGRWYSRAPEIASMPMSASKKPTLRRIVVYSAVIAVFWFASPTPVLFAFGATLALAGELLRIWACGHLRKNQAVIQSGPYAHVKNPLYLGTFMIMVGCLVAATNPNPDNPSRYLLLVALPFTLGVFFVYYLPYKFAREGDRLRRRFGPEWDQYAAAVPDFVPRLTPPCLQRDPLEFSARGREQRGECGDLVAARSGGARLQDRARVLNSVAAGARDRKSLSDLRTRLRPPRREAARRDPCRFRIGIVSSSSRLASSIPAARASHRFGSSNSTTCSR